MCRIVLALYPPVLCLFATFLMGLFLNSVFFILSLIFLADLVARYKDYRFVLTLEQLSPQILRRYRKSWCQRTLFIAIYPRAKGIYYYFGYRWYHLLPDGFISRNSPVFHMKWYKTLFYGTEEARGS